jgi:N-acetylneuraminic acid mutarotase
LYDPALGTWSVVVSMGTARDGHSATLLPNGRVLVVGGDNDSGYLSSAELYDPALGTWSFTTEDLATARYYHSATLLQDGRVMVVGGYNGSGYLSSAELYDSALRIYLPMILR